MIEDGTLYINWHLDDVIMQAEEDGYTLTSDQALEVLRLIEDTHDCNIGVNWGVISSAIDYLFGGE